MNASVSDREVFAAVLAEHARERAGDHPDHDALVAYLTGELAAEAEAEVNDHLVACRRCTASLLDLEPLALPDPGPENVADLATAAAWRDLRHRVFDEEPRARPAVGRHWSTAVAASLLVATLGMSVWVARLSGTADALRGQVAELSRPLVNMPFAYIHDTTRSSTEDAIEVAAGQTHFVLVFNSPELGDHAEYEVQFIDPDGKELLRVGGLRLSESLTLRLGLPRGLLPAGEYVLRVSGSDGQGWQLVEESRRRLVYLES